MSQSPIHYPAIKSLFIPSLYAFFAVQGINGAETIYTLTKHSDGGRAGSAMEIC
jgi:hypothetical protein